ncbi:uncharacterized protein LOC118570295 [Onychomys torridus]|uniref:uncharacterized protein LOC118570295 n=1 Tax=Onychomys torridus TaxID=38674 RepID=UPI00167F37AF|nr:uncharacterized protein LOC118570295 [Onychomys torridus]
MAPEAAKEQRRGGRGVGKRDVLNSCFQHREQRPWDRESVLPENWCASGAAAHSHLKSMFHFVGATALLFPRGHVGGGEKEPAGAASGSTHPRPARAPGPERVPAGRRAPAGTSGRGRSAAARGGGGAAVQRRARAPGAGLPRQQRPRQAGLTSAGGAQPALRQRGPTLQSARRRRWVAVAGPHHRVSSLGRRGAASHCRAAARAGQAALRAPSSPFGVPSCILSHGADFKSSQKCLFTTKIVLTLLHQGTSYLPACHLKSNLQDILETHSITG